MQKNHLKLVSIQLKTDYMYTQHTTLKTIKIANAVKTRRSEKRQHQQNVGKRKELG